MYGSVNLIMKTAKRVFIDSFFSETLNSISINFLSYSIKKQSILAMAFFYNKQKNIHAKSVKSNFSKKLTQKNRNNIIILYHIIKYPIL